MMETWERCFVDLYGKADQKAKVRAEHFNHFDMFHYYAYSHSCLKYQISILKGIRALSKQLIIYISNTHKKSIYV